MLRFLFCLIFLTTNLKSQPWYEVKAPDAREANWITLFRNFDSVNILAFGTLNSTTPFVVSSHDGGFSWTDTLLYHKFSTPGYDITVLPFSYEQYSMPDTSHIFISCNAAQMWVSENGGRSWSLRVIDSTVTSTFRYASIFFEPDLTTGLLFESDRNVLVSVDSSKTWTRYSLNRSDTLIYGHSQRRFIVNSHNFYLLNYNTDSGSFSISRTTNRGSSWVTCRLNGLYVTDGFVVDSSVAYMVGSRINSDTTIGGYYSIVYKTVDAGNSWTKILDSLFIDMPTTTFPFGLNRVTFYDRDLGIVSGNRQILMTTNGGTSWIPQQSAFTTENNGMWGMKFITRSSALIAKYDGAIVRWGQMKTDVERDSICLPSTLILNQVVEDALYFNEDLNNFSCTFYDLTGRAVLELKHCNNGDRVSIGNLQSGIYFVILSDGKKHRISKVLIVN